MTKTVFILPQILLTKAEYQTKDWFHSSIKNNQPQRPLEEIIWSASLSRLTNKCVLIPLDLSNLFLNTQPEIPQSKSFHLLGLRSIMDRFEETKASHKISECRATFLREEKGVKQAEMKIQECTTDLCIFWSFCGLDSYPNKLPYNWTTCANKAWAKKEC